MSPAARRLLLGSFPALEDALPLVLDTVRGGDPLAAAAVLVPAHTLRVHLRRRLVEGGRSHVNLHFLTLRDLVRRLAAEDSALAPRVPAPPFGYELLAREACRELSGKLDYLGAATEHIGFERAALATIRDLREAGLSPRELEEAAAEEGGLASRKLHDLARIWRGIDERAEAAGVFDETDRLQAAVRVARRLAEGDAPARRVWPGPFSALCLYGFYDFNPLQEALLAAACAVVPAVTAFLPVVFEAVDAFSEPARKWFGRLGFAEESLPEPPGTPTDLATVQAGLFAGREGAAAPGDGSVRILSAPGEAREAESLVRETLRAAERAERGAAGGPVTAPRIGILLRQPGSWSAPLAEALDAAGVRGALARTGPLAASPEGQACLRIAELAGSAFPRRAVMDLLLAAPLRPLPLPDGTTTEPPVAWWDALSREANVVEGASQWMAGLGRTEARAREAAEDPERPEPARRAAAARAEEILRFRSFLSELFGRLRAIGRGRTWTEWAEGVAALHEEILEATGARAAEAVRGACRELGAVDRVAEPPGPGAFAGLLSEALERRSLARGAFGREEPAVLPLLDARGAAFDIVLLPGLVEKGFPAPVRQDPLLSDAERRRLAEALSTEARPVRLEGKGRRQEEERLLFALACRSARKELLLSYSRLDPATGRTRVPSHFLLAVLGALQGAPADYDGLERFLREDARGVFVPIREGTLPPAEAIDCFGHDLAWMERALRAGGSGALDGLEAVSTFFARGRRATAARYGRHDFTEFDGVLRDGALREWFREAILGPGCALSPTRLEDYAACPFTYFVQYVLGVELRDESEEARSVDALDRGRLYHDIMQRFYRGLLEEGRGRPRPEDLERLEEVAASVFARFEQTGQTGLPLLWTHAREMLLADLREAVRREAAAESSWQARHCEIAFGLSAGDGGDEALPGAEAPVPYRTALGTVAFRGRIDRIDRSADGSAARVLDYKTGKAPRTGKKAIDFDGGRRLQLPVYLLAAERLLPDAVVREAAYAHWTKAGGFETVPLTRERWEAVEETFRDILGRILDGIGSGVFFPRKPEDGCGYCEAAPLCGKSRLEWKWRHPEGAGIAYEELRSCDQK